MPRNPVILAACLALAVGTLPAWPGATAAGAVLGIAQRLPTPRPIPGFSLVRGNGVEHRATEALIGPGGHKLGAFAVALHVSPMATDRRRQTSWKA